MSGLSRVRTDKNGKFVVTIPRGPSREIRLTYGDAEQAVKLIVAAPIPGQLDDIERLISRIDKGAVGTNNIGGNVPLRSQTIQMTKVFRPRSAEVTNVANILTQALTRKLPNGQIVTTASIVAKRSGPTERVLLTRRRHRG